MVLQNKNKTILLCNKLKEFLASAMGIDVDSTAARRLSADRSLITDGGARPPRWLRSTVTPHRRSATLHYVVEKFYDSPK